MGKLWPREVSSRPAVASVRTEQAIFMDRVQNELSCPGVALT